MNYILYIIIGIIAGILSGLVGIGGGTIVIPALIFFFGFTQHQAQGTTLALMIPPIGILAAYVYYRNGYVNIPVALTICAGFVAGGYIGALFATALPTPLLKKIFGFLLLIISVHMIASK